MAEQHYTGKMRVAALQHDLKRYLKINDMSQRAFGDKVEISSSTLSRLLAGNTVTLDYDNLEAIARGMDRIGFEYMDIDAKILTGIEAYGDNTMEKIEYIIKQDTKLDKNVKKGLIELMTVAYKNLAIA